MAKWFWIVGGINGAGKTTLVSWLMDRATPAAHADSDYFGALTDSNLVWLNPDRVAADWVAQGRFPSFAAANKAAADHVEAECDRLLDSGASVMVETVLSSEKYVRRVARAKQAGFKIGLIYIVLRTPELAVARVATRVAAGGHDVPAEKIAARWRRSLDNFPRFFDAADFALVFDNSDPTGAPDLLIHKSGAEIDISGISEFGRIGTAYRGHPLFNELVKALPRRDNIVGMSREP